MKKSEESLYDPWDAISRRKSIRAGSWRKGSLGDLWNGMLGEKMNGYEPSVLKGPQRAPVLPTLLFNIIFHELLPTHTHTETHTLSFTYDTCCTAHYDTGCIFF